MKRIVSEGMAARRTAAVAEVNAHYNRLAHADAHRDAAHAKKRAGAASILAGGDAYPEFHAEAELLGLSSVAFAEMIASKPDRAAVRELDRQRAMRAIETATQPADLEGLI